MGPTFLLLNDQQPCCITHCFRRRHAPSVRPHCTTDHHGLEVFSTLPRWYYLDDGDNNFFWHVNHSSRLPCASSNFFYLVSPLVRQCFLQSTDIVRCCFFREDDDEDAFAILHLWQCWLRRWYESRSFYQSPRVCQWIYLLVLFLLVSFKSLVFAFDWNALC